MKKKIILIFLLAFCTLNFTGCTTYLKDSNKKIVKNEITGQNLVKNILCQPTNKDILKKYSSNKIEIKKLPECSKFKVTSGGYEGVWNTIFVKPLAWLILKIGYLVKNFGLAIILTTLLIRLVMMPFTKKAAMQSENLKKVQPELDKLEKKYKGKTDQESSMQKSQEMLIIYKKYNINPMSGCLFSFIQLPLFMAFYEALYRLPAIFEGKFLTFELGTTPLVALSNGKWYYLILVVLVFIVTYYSFKLNSGASMSKEQASQMKMMRNITLVMIGTASMTVSSAISCYWITNSTFTLLQNLYVKGVKVK
ncbi:MAG TPA: YidC/Oxa1 family membrane protein insertase [Bacilli bacterium]|nr:YidC/Oxa1 family membrane protein insertase [Bacilli bacterium]